MYLYFTSDSTLLKGSDTRGSSLREILGAVVQDIHIDFNPTKSRYEAYPEDSSLSMPSVHGYNLSGGIGLESVIRSFA